MSSTESNQPGVYLSELTWPKAERVLTPETVVVVPLGAGAKEHGPHLPLNTDMIQAEYLARRIASRAAVVVAPTVSYCFYPAFVEYPGSVSLRQETARDLIVDICRSLAGFGPKRFYILNTGISTLAPLAEAATTLADEGILLRYSDPRSLIKDIEEEVCEQEGGSHADEAETSKMLYICPSLVDISRAVKDYHPQNGPGGMTRLPNGSGVYSPSGIWGDATLATADKGRRLVEQTVEALVSEIEVMLR